MTKYAKYRAEIRRWIKANKNSLCSLSYIPVVERLLVIQKRDKLRDEEIQNIFVFLLYLNFL